MKQIPTLLYPLLTSLALIAGCATSVQDRPASIDPARLGQMAMIVGSISKPEAHDGFGNYSLDLVHPGRRLAYRIRITTGLSPIGSGFPTDIVVDGREKSLFIRFIEPGRYFLARQAVGITNTFTTHVFGEKGQLSNTITAAAGDIIYIGEHAFSPRHEDAIFLWRDVMAPEHRIIDTFESDRDALRDLYPDIHWETTRNVTLKKRKEGAETFQDSNVWINPFG
jgi:hypothetical protein